VRFPLAAPEVDAMRITGVAMAAMVSAYAWGGTSPVTVCFGGANELEEIRILETQAKSVADGVFGRIGVRVRWRATESCPEKAIHIALSTNTPVNQHAGAFAYALPYQGTSVVVFADRVANAVDIRTAPCLLGYVVVHEMVHIIQGVVRHSDRGVMKARWTTDDYRQMEWRQLGFTREDVELILAGLSGRAAGLPPPAIP
jgi:hypothetical protein